MIVIKVGGSIVDGLHSSTILDLKNILKKDKVVLVHGGGKDVTIIGNKLGKEQKFIVSPGGVKSRYTDKETAEIYTMVMSGKINKAIVRLLLNNKINAAGIAGIDGSTIEATRKKKLLVVNDKGRKMIIGGGYTGKINKINTLLIRNLIDGNFVPVVSPIALSEEKEFLDIGVKEAIIASGNVENPLSCALFHTNCTVITK